MDVMGINETTSCENVPANLIVNVHSTTDGTLVQDLERPSKTILVLREMNFSGRRLADMLLEAAEHRLGGQQAFRNLKLARSDRKETCFVWGAWRTVT